MNRWAWILVAAAACAPPPAERLRNPKRIPHRDEEPPNRAPVSSSPAAQVPSALPRPNIDLSGFTPDFHDELRWPLTPMNHPVMEPKFPIAPVFAQPGIGWLELCERGVQNRSGGADKELISYLRGWCKAIDGDVDAACTSLAPLIHSTTPRLEAAVRNDLANILSQGHADRAEHYIRVYSLRDVGMLDLLAANYVEVGTTADALAINRNAIDSDDYATAATQCMRWTRQAVLEGEQLGAAFKQVETFARAPRPDETCVREFHKLVCWSRNECESYRRDRGVSSVEAYLINDIERWASLSSVADWWFLADRAVKALSGVHVLDDHELAAVGVAALANAVTANQGCSDLIFDGFMLSEPVLRKHATPEVTKVLDQVTHLCSIPGAKP